MTAPAQEQGSPLDVVTAAIDQAIAAISGGPAAGRTVGRSADDLVTAHLGPGNRLERFEADPRILRGGADQLAASLVEAYHEALDAAPAADPARRRQELAQAKENSAAAVGQLSASLQDALRHLVSRAGGEY